METDPATHYLRCEGAIRPVCGTPHDVATTTDRAEVTCVRCRGTFSYRHPQPGQPAGTLGGNPPMTGQVPRSRRAASSNWPLTGSPGKRLHTSDPLTEHDAAQRIDNAALRLLRIMGGIRQQDMMEPVKHSRYLTNVLGMLAAELQAWGVSPDRTWTEHTTGQVTGEDHPT